MTDTNSTCCGGSCGSRTEIARLARIVDAMQMARRLRHQTRSRDEENRAFLQRFRRAADEFAATHPDFAEAYGFLCAHRDAELCDLGHADPAERRRIRKREERAFVDQAFRDKACPAERLYALARWRGYGTDATEPENEVERSQPVALETLATMPDEDFAANWDRVIGGTGA